MIVLNAELKSTKSTLAYLPEVSRCCQNVMQGKRDSVIDGSVGPVGELVRIQLMISGCLEGPENQALEHFHDHGGQSDRSVVVQACYAGLLGNRRYGGGLEASWGRGIATATC